MLMIPFSFLPALLAEAGRIWDPQVAAVVGIFLAGVLAATVRYGLMRHREFILFKAHMVREEGELWPQIQDLARSVSEFRRETQVGLSDFRLEVIRLHFDHGERLARLETEIQLNTSETKVISTQVNGQTASLISRIDGQRREIEMIHTALDESNQRAEALATAAAGVLREKEKA